MKITKLSLMFLFILTLTPSGCSIENQTPAGIYRNISVHEAAELITQNADNPDFVIIDVRTPEEFEAAHIKNAILLDFYSEAFNDELDKLDKSKIYFVYCRTGNRSGQAMAIMETLGFTEVYNLSGGMVDWIANGFTYIK